MQNIAGSIANFINPILSLMLVYTFKFRGQIRWKYVAACTASVAIAVTLAEIGKARLTYPDPGGFPSGHETFAAATSACLAWNDRRWLAIVLPASLLMACLLVWAGYHTPIDVVGGAVLGCSVPTLVLRRVLGHHQAGAGAARPPEIGAKTR